MKNVTGIFHNAIEANEAVNSLLANGFKQDDLSLLMSEEAKTSMFDNNIDVTGTTNTEALKGSVTGAAFGGAITALIAGLTAAGTIATGGGLLLAGPIVAALSGAGAGGLLGGLSGALIGAGFAKDEASTYEAEIEAGRIVLVVSVDDDAQKMKAHNAIQQAGGNVKAA